MTSPARYEFADLTLDTGQRQLLRAGEPIDLGKLTYALLVALVEAAPNVLTHDDLVARVWGGRLTSPETVTQRVKLLRDALADDSEHPRYVGLVRGQGYRLLPPVVRVPVSAPPTPAPVSPVASAPPPSDVARTSSTRWLVPLAGVLVVAVGAVVAFGYHGGWNAPKDGTGETSAVIITEAQTKLPSVAVLPFVADSPDPDQQAFADGLASQIIDVLNRIPDLAVASGASSSYYKGKNETLATIGAALDVEHLLNGTVQTSGDRMKIRFELVAAGTSRSLWSRTYERRPEEDLFAIYEDIAGHVAAALQITLRVGTIGRVPGMPRNPAAYDELLEGWGYFRVGRPESLQRAIDHFVTATELDKSSAVAYMALATAYEVRAVYAQGRADEWLRKANEAAAEARALNPRVLDLLLWDARHAIDVGALSEAAVFFEEQLNEQRFPLLNHGGPNSAVWALRGYFFLQVGRVGEAITNLEHARAVNRFDAFQARLLGDAYADRGDVSAALLELDRGMGLGQELDRFQGYAVIAALASGDHAEISRRVAALSSSPLNEPFRRMVVFLDDRAGAIDALRTYAAKEPPDPDVIAPLILAHWAGYYGDAQTAFKLLRRIPKESASGSVWRPVFGHLRTLPEFKDLARELGLVDYWREHGWPDFCEPDGDDFKCYERIDDRRSPALSDSPR